MGRGQQICNAVFRAPDSVWCMGNEPCMGKSKRDFDKSDFCDKKE